MSDVGCTCDVLLDVLVDDTETDGDDDDCGWGENDGAGVSGGNWFVGARRLARDSTLTFTCEFVLLEFLHLCLMRLAVPVVFL